MTAFFAQKGLPVQPPVAVQQPAPSAKQLSHAEVLEGLPVTPPLFQTYIQPLQDIGGDRLLSHDDYLALTWALYHVSKRGDGAQRQQFSLALQQALDGDNVSPSDSRYLQALIEYSRSLPSFVVDHSPRFCASAA